MKHYSTPHIHAKKLPRHTIQGTYDMNYSMIMMPRSMRRPVHSTTTTGCKAQIFDAISLDLINSFTFGDRRFPEMPGGMRALIDRATVQDIMGIPKMVSIIPYVSSCVTLRSELVVGMSHISNGLFANLIERIAINIDANLLVFNHLRGVLEDG